MAVNALVAPVPVSRYYDNNGNPLAGGFVYTYSAGTVTPANTYTDSTASQVNANPITLNSRGEANIWWAPGVGIKLVVTDSNNNQISSTDQLYTGQAITSGSFTTTATGFLTTVTALVNWQITGIEVVVAIGPLGSGITSNAPTFTLTNIPSTLSPPTLTQRVTAAYAQNNGIVQTLPFVQIDAASSIWEVGFQGSLNTWTPSGIKTLGNPGTSFSYLLV
jgi:hypothetical protein